MKNKLRQLLSRVAAILISGLSTLVIEEINKKSGNTHAD